MTKKPVFPIPAMIRGGGIVAILVWLFNSFLVFWNVEFNALPFSAGWMWTLIVGTLLMVVTFTFFSFKGRALNGDSSSYNAYGESLRKAFIGTLRGLPKIGRA